MKKQKKNTQITPNLQETSTTQNAPNLSSPKTKKPKTKAENNAKPQKITIEAYDFNQCFTYMEKKLNVNLRDMFGTFKNRTKINTRIAREIEYRDFWHKVVKYHNSHREGFIHFHQEVCDEIEEDWAKEVYQAFLDEFAENKEIKFFVDW